MTIRFRTCQRVGCNRLVPPERSKYCSWDCLATVKRVRDRSRMEVRRVGKPADDRRPTSPRRPRVCLACDETFDSAGPWNRICPLCALENEEAGVAARPVMGGPTEEFVGVSVDFLDCLM